jgi:drug/metabolite transporter (DMT)-like permease
MACKDQSKAYFYASLTVFFWSTVATAFKIALRDLNYIELLLVANITSLIVFAVLIIFQKEFAALKKTSFSELGLSSLQGLLNPFVYYLLVFKAYSLLPAQVAQPANFIWPVVLMLLSVPLLKQPMKITGILALLISFTGVLILSSQGDPGSFKIVEPIGVGLALLSSLIWALFWILSLRDPRSNLVKLFLGSLFSSLYIFLLASVTGNVLSIFYKPIAAAIYVGVFELGITYTFWLKALQLSETTGKISNFVYLTPFISLIFIHSVLHEKVHYTSVIGLCLIVGGILVGQIRNGHRSKDASSG